MIAVPSAIVARLLELDAMIENVRVRHPEVLANSLLRDMALVLDQLRLAVGNKVP